ncbi:sporulation protein [uncultured Ferrimonas sp.]|uniref:sporulation protein n=1 Tax=uncultured Ferrimonas sp. TaxID=432640 RepID=UPI0026066121|nr:sporulation protein [uncultured Ferrimonas sp.]
MSWIGKVMSTIGINGTRVDTLLEQQQHQPGEPLHAKVQINGGNRAAKVDAVKFSVWTQAQSQPPVQIAHCVIAEQLRIDANSEQRLPVQLSLPDFTPLSLGGVSTWLQTELDIPLAPDPQDTDAIEIVATEEQQQVFALMQELGYQLDHTELEPLPQQSRYQVPFLQQFHFHPQAGSHYHSRLQIAWEPNNSEFELLITEETSAGSTLNHRLEVREPVQARLHSQLKQLLDNNNPR